MRKFTFITLAIVLYSLSGFSQEFESALIPMEDGAVFAFTSAKKSFTIDLIGEKLQPLEAKNFVIVDNWIFQAFTLGFDNPKKVDLSTEDEQKKSLSQYVMYEIDYFKNELGYNCDSLKLEWGKINEKYFYFWHYKTPDSMETLKKQMYLTTICHDQILNMSIPLDNDRNFEDGKNFLFKIGKTLVLSDKPIDFNELYYKYNK
jgi:hypothetical protein